MFKTQTLPDIKKSFKSVSRPLEPPRHLPVGDAAVVFGLLPPGRVHVMVDDIVAHRRAQHRRAIERGGCIPQGRGNFAYIRSPL